MLGGCLIRPPWVVGFLDVWMFGSSDLHGFKLERCLSLSRLDQCRRVAHWVAAVRSHVPGGLPDVIGGYIEVTKKKIRNLREKRMREWRPGVSVDLISMYQPCDHVSSASGVWTRRTLVRLLPSVRSLVGRQVVASGEHLQGKKECNITDWPEYGGSHWHFWSYFVTFFQFWSYLPIVWSYLVIFGPTWSYLVKCCNIWSYLVIFGHIWSNLVKFGHIW